MKKTCSCGREFIFDEEIHCHSCHETFSTLEGYNSHLRQKNRHVEPEKKRFTLRLTDRGPLWIPKEAA